MSIKIQYKSDTKPKRAVVYLRVSTEEQVDNFSLGTQENICKKEALRRGFEIAEIFREEGKSAKTITGSLIANTIEPLLTWIFRLMDAYNYKLRR